MVRLLEVSRSGYYAWINRKPSERARRSQYDDIADAEKRAVRGNTFSYLVIALATVVENMRKIVSFYKNQLSVRNLSPKNNRLPSSYWPSPMPAAESEDSHEPPG